MKILFHFDASDLLADKARNLAAPFAVACCPESSDTAFDAEIGTTEVLWHSLKPVTAQVIARAPKLRLIQKIGTGVNTIDLVAAKERGIAVCNLPGANGRAVAEMALLLILACLRRLRDLDPLVENHHRGGILRLSLAPAPHLDPAIQRAAEQAARAVFDELQYVGVLAIEFFEQNGKLLANEMAPRVHNSGHWTIEGALTSQFENHLRAVVGLPLGSTLAIGSSAMLNLIGETPDPAEVLVVRDAHLHLYGKSPRAGRKLGHVTLRASSSEQLASRLSELSSFFHRPEYCLDAVLSRPATLRA